MREVLYHRDYQGKILFRIRDNMPRCFIEKKYLQLLLVTHGEVPHAALVEDPLTWLLGGGLHGTRVICVQKN